MTFEEKFDWAKAKVRGIYHRDSEEEKEKKAARAALADLRRESVEEPEPVSEEAGQDVPQDYDEPREEPRPVSRPEPAEEPEDEDEGDDVDSVSEEDESFDETTERLLKNPDPYLLKKYLAELKAFDADDPDQEDNVAENIRHVESVLQSMNAGESGRMIPGGNVRQNVFVMVDGKRQTPVRYHLRRTPKGRYTRVVHHTRHFTKHKVKRRRY
jgi:hypothetical protein